MPPGATNARENRFALLASNSPPKKKKLSKETAYNFFPALPSTNQPNPKFLVIACSDENKTIADYSCFVVHKSLQIISKDIISISELRDGNLLLLVKDGKTADKFLSSTALPGVCNIKCSLHTQLNITKGTVYAPYLNRVPEEEIVAELRSQGVVSAFKFNKTIDGKTEPSGVILLSFDEYNLPKKIDISWHSVKVREYIPNPMRCKTCQLLGHTAKWCKNTAMCPNCNLPPHSPNVCTRTFCANCSEQHSAASSTCKMFIQQKEILAIKIKNKCSMQKARQIHRDQSSISVSTTSTSYAAVTSNSVSLLNRSTNDNSNHGSLSQIKTPAVEKTLSIQSALAENLRTREQPKEDLSKFKSLTNTNISTNTHIKKISNNNNLPPPSISASIQRTDSALPTNNSHSNLQDYSPPITRKSAKRLPIRSLSNVSLESSLSEANFSQSNDTFDSSSRNQSSSQLLQHSSSPTIRDVSMADEEV